MPLASLSLRSAALAAALVATGVAASAQSTPPANALPLSKIVAMLEAELGPHRILEAEWYAEGYWEILYVTADGRQIEVARDPVTGLAPR
jgi:hypothetical protein